MSASDGKKANKLSPWMMVLIIVLIVLAGAGGAMFAIMGMNKSTKADNIDETTLMLMNSGRFITEPKGTLAGPPQGPWLALRRKMEGSNWVYLGSSEEGKITEDTLAGVKTLVLCAGSVGSWSEYSSFGVKADKTKRTEEIIITYIDLATGAKYGEAEKMDAQALPKFTTNLDDITYSNADVLQVIRSRMDAGTCPGCYPEDWIIDENGTVTGRTWFRAEREIADPGRADFRFLAIPRGARKITSVQPATPDTRKMLTSFDEERSQQVALYIPDTVTDIADGALDGEFFIIAPAGSYAETWALEHGIPCCADGSATVRMPGNVQPSRLNIMKTGSFKSSQMGDICKRFGITRAIVDSKAELPENTVPVCTGLHMIAEQGSPAETAALKISERLSSDISYAYPEIDAGDGALSVLPGETLLTGRYEQDGDPGNGAEPIQWRVLTVHGDKALILSSLVLDMQPYHDGGTVYWDESNLRKWLNGEFRAAAFTDAEAASLLSAKNMKNGKVLPDPNGSECIFILSEDEYSLYQNGVYSRAYAIPSEYAVSAGAERNSKQDGMCSFFLRPTNYRETKETALYGILPAVWVSLSSDAVIAGNTPSMPVSASSQEEKIAAAAERLAVGDSVFYGNYPQDGIPGSRSEIEWTVLDIKDGSALLLSRYVLDVRCLEEDKYNYTYWDRSSMRDWLNANFLSEAFTPEQIAAIKVTNVSNAASEFGPNGSSSYNDTPDKVFLLSNRDVTERYFTTDAQRCAGSVPAVTYQSVTEAGSCRWWLRCINSSSGYAIEKDGKSAILKITDTAGIRPAMWLDLSKYLKKE